MHSRTLAGLLGAPLLGLAACAGDENAPAVSVQRAELAADLVATAQPAPARAQEAPRATGAAARAVPRNANADHARLVPEGTVCYVEVASADALKDALDGLAAAFGETSGQDPFLFLHMMLMAGEGMELVDRTRPLGIAVAIDPATGPQPTFLVPVSDTAAFAGHVAGSPAGHTAVAAGEYVGVSQAAGYALAERAHPLAADMPAGVVSARVDLATLAQTFGPMIEMLMSQAAQSASVADAPPGFDAQAVVETYVSGVRNFLASAETVELAWRVDGTVTALEGSFGVRAGSPLAGFATGGSGDIEAVAGFVDESEPLVFLAGMDVAAVMEHFGPFVESMARVYPEGMRTDMMSTLAAFEELYPLFGDGMAGSGGFGPEGMHFVYHFAADDPAALVAAQVEVFGSGAVQPMGTSVEGPRTLELAGVEVTQFRCVVDAEALGEMTGTVDAAELEAMQAAMEAVYGEDGLVFSMAPLEDRMVLVLGGDDAYVEEALIRADAPARSPSAALSDALGRVRGADASFVVRADLARFLHDFKNVMVAAMGGPAHMGDPGPAPDPVPLVFYGAIGATEWSGGATLDVAGMKALIGTLQGF